MSRPILVPIDGSPFSEQAIPIALGIARRNKLPLELMLVHEPYIPALPRTREVLLDPVLDSEWRSRQGAYMRDMVARLSKSSAVPVNGAVMDGSVIGSIAEHAATIKAQLIVVATHGGAPAGRLWLASIPRALTRTTPAPVLLVKPGTSGTSETFGQVVIAMDGSKVSETAIDHALLVAGKSGVEYTLLRVVTPMEEWELGAGAWAADEDLAVSEANAYLALHARRLRAQGYRVQTEVVRAARAADAILRFARNHAADMIAVTTHSRSVASRFFRRSVADRIARATEVTALVARRFEPAPSTNESVAPARNRKKAAARASRALNQ